jgi:hypothetical protein
MIMFYYTQTAAEECTNEGARPKAKSAEAAVSLKKK